MDKYVDLGISFFDPEFTLNPQRYLADLYPRRDILGFSSAGMNFLFRQWDCYQVMHAKHCTRALESHADKEREARYAQCYPRRARHFMLSYLHGEVDMGFKLLITRLIAGLAERASYEPVEAVVRPLAGGGVLSDFVDAVGKLPLRMFLDTCRLPYDEAQLATLHAAGVDFLKALENFSDEALIARADAAIGALEDYVVECSTALEPGSLLAEFMREGKAMGLAEDQLQANIAGNFLAALSNTIGMSSAFILRTLVHQPTALGLLRAQPELLQRDATITELLRLDNHVKALSRCAHAPVPLGAFTLDEGESVMLFFPGVNGDPDYWQYPAHLDFSRDFSGAGNVVFGGAIYSCIGRRLALAFLKVIVRGYVRYLPDGARINDADIEMDGSWVAERIIRHMPIHLPPRV